MTAEQEKLMLLTIEVARKGMEQGHGGPFGCVIVKDGTIIATGHNQVLLEQDPTAHAEVVAIREACRKLGSFQLTGCELYTSCEPCPMCLGAIYWARPSRVFYAASKEDASAAGFDDSFIYQEIRLPFSDRSIPFEAARPAGYLEVFQAWKDMEGKILY